MPVQPSSKYNGSYDQRRKSLHGHGDGHSGSGPCYISSYGTVADSANVEKQFKMAKWYVGDYIFVYLKREFGNVKTLNNFPLLAVF